MPSLPTRVLFCCSLLAPLGAQSAGELAPGELAPAELDQLVPEFATTARPTMAFGDLDGDGVVDLVLGRNGQLSWRAGRSGKGEPFGDERPLGCSVGLSCENRGQPVLADIDRDGDLDLIAVDATLGRRERLVCFTNDGKAGFAAAVDVRSSSGDPLQWLGQASGIAVVDDDGDGWLDAWVASPNLQRFAGGAAGFADTPAAIDASSDAGIVVLMPRESRPCRVLVVHERRLVALERNGGRFVAVDDLGAIEGDSGQVSLALDRAAVDGSQSVLVAELLRPRADAASLPPAQQQRLAAARAVLQSVQAQRLELYRKRPPFDDAAARAAWRARADDLHRFAAEPSKVIAELLPAKVGGPVTQRLRRLLVP